MDRSQQQIADALVASYHAVGGINRIECGNLPSKRRIGQVCEQLLQLLFPGYHDEEPIPEDELEMITGERIAALIEKLEVEIGKSLRLRGFTGGYVATTGSGDCDGEDSTAPHTTSASEEPADILRQARELTCRFLGQLPCIRELLRTDVEAAYEGDPAAKNFDEILLSYPCIEAIAIQRCAHVLYEEDVPLIPRIMTEWAHGLTGIDIHPGATIGSHFFIDHGTGVVIGETCVIGNHVKLYHGVTLGARNFPKDAQGRVVKGNKRHPNVEDWVVIYPNATVLGGKTILGTRSTVGANVFLRESVPPYSFVSTEGERLHIIDKRTGEVIEPIRTDED
ncbi:MAG: serine acetyltransferase [Verrucomicrobiales bacterium]|nr:serine acetyltransferase [Verrucomicrobiales bacterium]